MMNLIVIINVPNERNVTEHNIYLYCTIIFFSHESLADLSIYCQSCEVAVLFKLAKICME